MRNISCQLYLTLSVFSFIHSPVLSLSLSLSFYLSIYLYLHISLNPRTLIQCPIDLTISLNRINMCKVDKTIVHGLTYCCMTMNFYNKRGQRKADDCVAPESLNVLSWACIIIDLCRLENPWRVVEHNCHTECSYSVFLPFRVGREQGRTAKLTTGGGEYWEKYSIHGKSWTKWPKRGGGRTSPL